MKKLRKIIKRVFLGLAGVFIFLILAFAAIIFFQVTFNLNLFRPSVERAVSQGLNRSVHFNGPVRLKAGLSPTLEIHELQIDNPDDWNESVFASMETARVQIGLMSLLKRKIDIGEFTAKQVVLNLQADINGNNNWAFGTSTHDLQDERKSPDRTTKPAAFSLQGVDKMDIENLSIHYRDDSVDATFDFGLDELKGSAPQGQPLKLSGKGSVQTVPYSFSVDAGALEQIRLRSQLYPVSLDGQIAGSSFTAQGSMGTDDDQPTLELNCSLSKVNIGSVLEWMKVDDNVAAHTDNLSLGLYLRGGNLEKLLTQSRMTFSLEGGSWTLLHSKDGPGLEIHINNGSIGVLPETPLTIDIDGLIDQTPINIAIQGTELIDYIRNPKQVPVFITAESAGTTLDFNGTMAVPLAKKDVSLELTVRGETLDSLNELLKLDLPPIGPYEMIAQVAMNPDKVDLSNLQLNVGSSDLSGSMSIRVDGIKPDIRAEFVSSLLQIDDFAPGQWNLEDNRFTSQAPAVEDGVDTEDSAVLHKEEFFSLLSPEALNKVDAQLSVQLDSVKSGDDTVGKGRLKAGLQDGRFSIDPLELELADGSGQMEFSYYPTGENAQIQLSANVTGLDVGILVRRKKPESKMGGRLNLDLRLDSTAPALSRLMANGSGHFDFGFTPENFNAGIIDLWAVNVMSALSHKVDSEPTSTINCVVASFEMDQGLMQDRVIFMDTTRMSVEGTAVIDFQDQTIEVKAKPTAKRPEFFSIAIPINISGTFDDFGIGVKPGHLITTIGSFVTSPVHVPLRRLFGGKIPTDGKDACRIAWERRNQPIP